jgi:hypothetical protein
MAKYFQLGNEMNKTPYSGEDANGAYYSGIHKTTAMTLANTDTLEIPLCEVPVGTRLEGIMLQMDSCISTTANITCAFVLRKKSNSIYSGTSPALTGTASGLPDITLSGGILNGNAGVGAMAGSGATVIAPPITNATLATGVNIWAMLMPQGIEGNTTINNVTGARPVLQDSYYLGLLFTSTGLTAFPAGINIQIGVDGEFIGTL